MARKGRRTGLGITVEGDISIGPALRHARSDGFRREGAEDPRTGSLPCLGKDACRCGAFEIFDARKEEKNPMIGRIREADPVLRRNGKTRTTQYRHADHRPYGNHLKRVANHVGHRTGFPSRL